MAKIGVEVEGARNAGEVTLFVDAREFTGEYEKLNYRLSHPNCAIAHLYISDHQNVLDYSSVVDMVRDFVNQGKIITIEVTAIRQDLHDAVGIMLNITDNTDLGNITKLRPDDEIKISKGLHVACFPKSSLFWTVPSQFHADFEVTI